MGDKFDQLQNLGPTALYLGSHHKPEKQDQNLVFVICANKHKWSLLEASGKKTLVILSIFENHNVATFSVHSVWNFFPLIHTLWTDLWRQWFTRYGQILSAFSDSQAMDGRIWWNSHGTDRIWADSHAMDCRIHTIWTGLEPIHTLWIVQFKFDRFTRYGLYNSNLIDSHAMDSRSETSSFHAC